MEGQRTNAIPDGYELVEVGAYLNRRDHPEAYVIDAGVGWSNATYPTRPVVTGGGTFETLWVLRKIAPS